MLPLIDLCNHSFQPNCEIRRLQSGTAEMCALHPVAAGQPLLLSYGDLSNDFLLLDYGFLVDGNPHDSVQLRFDLGLLEVGLARSYSSCMALLSQHSHVPITAAFSAAGSPPSPLNCNGCRKSEELQRVCSAFQRFTCILCAAAQHAALRTPHLCWCPV